MTTMTKAATHTLRVRGAVLSYVSGVDVPGRIESQPSLTPGLLRRRWRPSLAE